MRVSWRARAAGVRLDVRATLVRAAGALGWRRFTAGRTLSETMTSRTRFVAHVLVIAALAVMSTGGGCGPSGPDLPPTAVACASSDAAAPPEPTEPFVWIGTTGDDGVFRPVTDGETLSIVHGAQGGTHVWGAARLYAPGAGTWRLRFGLTSPDGEAGSIEQALAACAGGVAEVTYVTVFFSAVPPWSGVLSVDATAESGSGTTGGGGSGGASPVHAEVPIRLE